MEITFPSDYPTSPFFLRMVTPRCVWCASLLPSSLANPLKLVLLSCPDPAAPSCSRAAGA